MFQIGFRLDWEGATDVTSAKGYWCAPYRNVLRLSKYCSNRSAGKSEYGPTSTTRLSTMSVNCVVSDWICGSGRGIPQNVLHHFEY